MSRRVAPLVWALLFLVMGMAGCQTGAPQPAPTRAATAPAIAVEPVATDTNVAPTRALPTATATPTPTPSPSPTATATTPAIRRLAVPNSWRREAEAVAAALSSEQSWQIVVAEDAAQLLESGEVDAALLAGDGGFPAGYQPLALAVPFEHEWDTVTGAQALEIQRSGHSFVQVIPWHELAPQQRALRVDGKHASEPGYALQQSWSLHAVPELHQEAERFGEQLQLSVTPGDVHLAAVGDIMLDRALGATIAAGDTRFPFALVDELLRAADYTIGNVESALGNTGEAAAKSYTFRAPPAAARSLAEAGFDLVSLANNHALDFGPQALMQGLELLQAEGIASVGAGRDVAAARQPHIADINGLRFGFLGYVNVPVEGRAPYFDTASWSAGAESPGLAWAEPGVVAEDVAALVEQVDHVVVILHSGYEYVPSPSPEQTAAAHSAIDAGATLVIGHHAHILQGVEFRADGAIVYGLGNFAFNITGPPQTAILNAWFDENGLRQLDFQAAIIQGSGQPAPANGSDGAAIRRQIYALSRGLN